MASYGTEPSKAGRKGGAVKNLKKQTREEDDDEEIEDLEELME